jgi:hypothetical protein
MSSKQNNRERCLHGGISLARDMLKASCRSSLRPASFNPHQEVAQGLTAEGLIMQQIKARSSSFSLKLARKMPLNGEIFLARARALLQASARLSVTDTLRPSATSV